MSKTSKRLSRALWRIYNRPERPQPWASGGNLPWDEPAFSRRMLREHLDQSHAAASRPDAERGVQIDWLWEKLELEAGRRVLDVTCGPGLYAVDLAARGCRVTGIDFGPAAIAYARERAQRHQVADRCTFVQADVRAADFGVGGADAALFLYGQLAVFPPEEAHTLLSKAARALRPGGKLCVELLNQERVDKERSTWWYTDDTGLWGEAPYLHLGERDWLAEEEMSVERFYIVHLEDGRLDEITLCDQTYAVETLVGMLRSAGFGHVDVYADWAGLPLYDAAEWVIYVAQK